MVGGCPVGPSALRERRGAGGVAHGELVVEHPLLAVVQGGEEVVRLLAEVVRKAPEAPGGRRMHEEIWKVVFIL